MKMVQLKDNLQSIRTAFTSHFSYFVIESVIEGNTPAEVYVDQIENPNITLVWDTKHNIYCGGNGDKATLQKAVDYIKSNILTQDVRQNSGVVKVLYENQGWKEAIMEGTQELSPYAYPRSVYRHSLEHIPSFPNKEHRIIQQIDEALLNSNRLQNIEGLVEELIQMWGTVESFLSKGYGFCAIKDESVAAWCTGEYFSKNWCGIGIETYEPYQGQGIATATTVEMLKYCKAQNKIPHWDCWKNNIPSVKTAEKAGFEKLMDYEIFFFKF